MLVKVVTASLLCTIVRIMYSLYYTQPYIKFTLVNNNTVVEQPEQRKQHFSRPDAREKTKLYLLGGSLPILKVA